MTLEASGSQADVLHLCKLAGLPRAAYYRHLARRGEEADECELRNLIQSICLKHHFHGYRRVTAVITCDRYAGIRSYRHALVDSS